MIGHKAYLAVALKLFAATASAQDAELVPLYDLPDADLTEDIIYQRCSAFYEAMHVRGLETGVAPSNLDLVATAAERGRAIALHIAGNNKRDATLEAITMLEAAYLKNFRDTDTLITQIDSPNRLFFADRAGCREVGLF